MRKTADVLQIFQSGHYRHACQSLLRTFFSAALRRPLAEFSGFKDNSATGARFIIAVVFIFLLFSMTIRKLNPHDQLSLPSLQRKSAEIRRAAADTIRAAEEHLIHSEAIALQSEEIVDRARQTLEMVGRVPLRHAQHIQRRTAANSTASKRK